MQRSLFRYTTAFLLPLLAVGLVLTGCDSTGSNGGGGDETATFEYPSNNYGAETVTNLLAFELGVRVGNATDNSESALLDRYEGNADDITIRAAQDLTTEGQNVYSDIQGGVDLSSQVSTADLLRGNELESPDSPNAGSPVNTDELLRYYFQEAGANNVGPATSNGIVLSQFAEKMLLGTPLYGQGAAILSDFANGNVSSNRAEQWDAAFGYFGFPRTLEPFVDYEGGGEGLADGPARDIDGDGVDLTSEYVHTWAAYAIERSATAEANSESPSNNFAQRAFEALVQGRKEIANENYENLSSRAQTALDAWEATVAVNVIHYINSMEGNLEDASGTLEGPQGDSSGDVGEDAWGEAKAFAWSLQFYSRDALRSQDLNNVLEDIGNDPPYGEMTASEYASDLQDATDILADTYDFDSDNVQSW
ncbi:hypothetical protein GGP55_002004 [Salinibacter ruber]|uniref:hypothetical protein n=1 Tax=Salinibacter ruber TaxID=146919 RepID=UPI002167BACB|nr:hypothetical protein [Salinibacter ruber]MCS3631398.1 hypothetical protein [Salinibacter ruber]